MNKKILWFGLICVCVLATAASCNSGNSNPTLTNVKMCTQTEGMQCADDQLVFSTASEVIFCTTILENAPKGATVTANWTYFNGQEPIEIQSSVFEAERSPAKIAFSLSRQDNTWPKGNYEVELNISDKNAKPIIKNFKIE
jgi:hypothetical protein